MPGDITTHDANGRIESSWKEERGAIHYAFTVPGNTTATLAFAGCIVERCPRRGETYPKMQGNRIYW
ncbi:MAG: alpha-L-rhamnosidase C-terminal domain-containing protein [Bacteroides cellulosilyticus]